MYRNTRHLEFFKNINFKWSNERPLGIAHMLLFILYYSDNITVYSIADLGWPTFCWPVFCVMHNSFVCENYNY